FVEAWIASFDREEETVVGRATKPRPIEHRVIQSRQSVHDLPREECREGRKEDRQLKNNWEKCRYDSPREWFSVDIERVENPGRAPLENERGENAADAPEEHPEAQPGFAQAHGVVHSMDWKRRENVPSFEPSIANAFCRLVKRGRARVFGGHSVNAMTG